MRVLILGGTGEARELAAALHAQPGVSVTSSLAGRVSDPALPRGATVVGGFGGASGLAAFLAERRFDVLVDATHPLAQTITRHAVDACATVGLPLLVLRRPGWAQRPGDRWHRVTSIHDAAVAARELCPPDSCVFLTTGRRELAPFASDSQRRYLIRAVDPPDPASLPGWATVLLDRGPYTVEAESALMTRNEVRMLVTRDSGGDMTYAKIEAARSFGIDVVVVDRPPLPDPHPALVQTVTEATDWCMTKTDHDHRR